jgi:hypothetical protein
MSTGRRLAGAAVLVLFTSALVARPILSNPAVLAALDGGVTNWTTLLALPVVVVGLVLVARRLGRLSEGESTQSNGLAGTDRARWGADGGDGGSGEANDIEEEPPEAPLGAHLDHLRTELDDPEAAGDLDTLEAVVETVEDEQIPGRCPRAHCDAIWTEQTVLGVKNGRYELLDDGQTVVCLDCEETVTVE